MQKTLYVKQIVNTKTKNELKQARNNGNDLKPTEMTWKGVELVKTST